VRTFLKEWERETGGRLRHSLVSRDSLSEKDVRGKDLVVALGGDGTTLIASHWISSSFSSSREGDENEDDGGEDASSFVRPKLIGINTDPAVLAPCLTFTKKAEDERRSTGWLCAADANDVEDVLREILFASSEASPLLPQNVSSEGVSDGKGSSNSSSSSSSSSSSISNSGSLKRRPIRANRIRVKVNGQTWKTMPLALNDVLICHNSPAALSRYSVLLEESDLVNKPPPPPLSDGTAPSSEVSKAYYHIRSSGLRLCTALGSTAAMKSAGGFAMSRNDQRIQFHDREPIYYDHEPKPPGRGRGFYAANKTTKFRWNTRVGKIFVDGAHVCHDIKIGDEIEVESAIGEEIEIYCKNFRNIALT
jgi:NAD+ kinase